jgi:hypothetical protein
MAIFLDAQGFSGLQIGIFFSSATLTGLLFVFAIGIITDRVKPWILVGLGIVLRAIFFGGVSLTSSFPLVLLLFVTGGLGLNIFEVSMDSFALKKTHSGTSLSRFAFVKSLAAGVSFVAGGALLLYFPFSSVLRLIGLIMLLSSGIVMLLPDVERKRSATSLYFRDMLSPSVMVFAALLFVFSMHWGIEDVAYSLFLKHSFGLNMLQMGLFMGIPIIFLAISATLAGRLFDRGLHASSLMLIAFVLSGLGLAGMGLAPSTPLALLARILHEAGDGFFIIFLLMGVKSLFVHERIGGDYGLIALVTISGRMIGSLVFSPMGAAWGYNVPHIAGGIIILLFVWPIFLFQKPH